jgi:hypothetical protein
MLRDNYIGFPANCNSSFGAENIDDIISSLSCGKAAGLDCMTVGIQSFQHC